MHTSSSPSPSSAGSREDSSNALDGLADRIKAHSLLVAVEVGNNLSELKLYYYSIQVLSALQLIYFTVGVQQIRSWNLTLWVYAVTGVRSSTLQVQQQIINQNTLTLLLGLSLTFVFFWLLSSLAIITWAVNESKNLRGWVKGYIRIFTLVCIPTEGLLLVVFSQMFHVSLSCFANTSASRFATKLNLALGSLLFISSLSLVVLYERLKLAINPLSVSPAASYSQTRGLMQLMIKAILPCYEVFSDPAGSPTVYRVFLTLLHSCTLFLRIHTPIEPHRPSSIINSLCDVVQVLTAGIMILEGFGSRSNLELLYFPLALFTVVFACQRIEKLRMIAALKQNPFGFETIDEVDMFLYSFVVLLDRGTSDEEFKEMLWLALKSCSDHLHKKIIFTRPVPQQLLTAAAQLKALLTDQSKPQVFRKQVFQLADSIIDWLLVANRHETSSGKIDYCRMIRASILSSRLENPWESIHQFEKIQNEGRPTWGILIGITRMLKNIEHELIEAELRDNQNTGVNIIKLVQLEKAISELYKLVEKNTDQMIRFWEELLSESLNGDVLRRIGFKVTDTQAEVKSQVEKIISEHPNQVQTLMLYGQYLDSVLNEQEEASKYLAKASSVHQSVKSNNVGAVVADETRTKLYSQLNPCILVVSANRHNMGTIKSANTECTKVLGWTPEELVGKKVETIMPKVYAIHHDKWMHRFFSGQGVGLIDTQVTIWALNKSGFLHEVTLLLKIYPYLHDGISIIGAITPCNPKATILIQDDQLIGITDDVYREFGIHPSLLGMAGGFPILSLFDQIQSIHSLKAVGESGTITTLNTKFLLETKFFPDAELIEKPVKNMIPKPEAYGTHGVKLLHCRGLAQTPELKSIMVYEVKEIQPRYNEEKSSNSLDDNSEAYSTQQNILNRNPKGFTEYLEKTRVNRVAKENRVPVNKPVDTMIEIECTPLKRDSSRKNSRSLRNSRSTDSKTLKNGYKHGYTKLKIPEYENMDVEEVDEVELQQAETLRRVKEQRSSMKKLSWNSSILLFFISTFLYLWLLFAMEGIILNNQATRRKVLNNKFKSAYFDYTREYFIVRSLSVGQGLYITALLPAALQILPDNPPLDISAEPYNSTLADYMESNQMLCMNTVINALKWQDSSYTDTLLFIKSYRDVQFPLRSYRRDDTAFAASQHMSTRDLTYLIVNLAEGFINILSGEYSTMKIIEVTDSYLRFLATNLFSGIVAALIADRSTVQLVYTTQAQQISWINIGLLCFAMLILSTFCIWVYFEFYPLFKKNVHCVYLFGSIASTDLNSIMQEIKRFKASRNFPTGANSTGLLIRKSANAIKSLLSQTDKSTLAGSDNEDMQSIEWREMELRKRLGAELKDYVPIEDLPFADPKLADATKRHIEEVKPRFIKMIAPNLSQEKGNGRHHSKRKTSHLAKQHAKSSKNPNSLTSKQLINVGVAGSKPSKASSESEAKDSTQHNQARENLAQTFRTTYFFKTLTIRVLIAFVIVSPFLFLSLYWDAVAVSRLDSLYKFQENILKHQELVQHLEAATQNLLMVASVFQPMGVIDPLTCLKVMSSSVSSIIDLDNEITGLSEDLPTEFQGAYQFYLKIQDHQLCSELIYSTLASSGYNTSTLRSACESIDEEQGSTRTLRDLFNIVDQVIVLYHSAIERVQQPSVSGVSPQQLMLAMFAFGSPFTPTSKLFSYNRVLGSVYDGYSSYLTTQTQAYFLKAFWSDLAIGLLLALFVLVVWIICCASYFLELQKQSWMYRQLLCLIPEGLLLQNEYLQEQLTNILDRF